VRLSRENEIARAMSEAVKTALLSNDLIPMPLPLANNLGESGRIPATSPDPSYDFTPTAPCGISEVLACRYCHD